MSTKTFSVGAPPSLETVIGMLDEARAEFAEAGVSERVSLIHELRDGLHFWFVGFAAKTNTHFGCVLVPGSLGAPFNTPEAAQHLLRAVARASN